ncbi:uncharacterized protein LOC119765146 [Culex quinquefasciatus]|uniref:uncharacterized protein LOC119765146 n=1 Tax=Culex quinquefasciatus TaxID=7176 RepID=UPI00016DACC3|nr:uncharacterized protein LOC119765146 [Culex quinquefasciatus]XP_038104317.1 uncharacterized protein LOC119765146 [Culex quinquefasciatus]
MGPSGTGATYWRRPAWSDMCLWRRPPGKVIDEVVPLWIVPVPREPFKLAMYCDHGLLTVDVDVGVSICDIYSVLSLMTPTAGKLYEIRTTPECGVRRRRFCGINMFSMI